MRETVLSEKEIQGQSPAGKVPSVIWKDSVPVQRLLDVISAILAEEYIMTVKQNPEVFIKQGETK